MVRVHLSRPVQVQGRAIEGTQTDDLLSMAGGFFRIKQECVGEAREDGLDREAMLMPLLYR